MEQHSFQEVMRQLNRMCSHHPNCGDSGCPLSDECGNIGSYSSNAKQAMRIERIVISWAAENPKPVFPTWMEWLAANVPGTDADSIYEAVQVLNRTYIPADIAQKLGIEPKEG